MSIARAHSSTCADGTEGERSAESNRSRRRARYHQYQARARKALFWADLDFVLLVLQYSREPPVSVPLDLAQRARRRQVISLLPVLAPRASLLAPRFPCRGLVRRARPRSVGASAEAAVDPRQTERKLIPLSVGEQARFLHEFGTRLRGQQLRGGFLCRRCFAGPAQQAGA